MNAASCCAVSGFASSASPIGAAGWCMAAIIGHGWSMGIFIISQALPSGIVHLAIAVSCLGMGIGTAEGAGAAAGCCADAAGVTNRASAMIAAAGAMERIAVRSTGASEFNEERMREQC